MQGGGRGGAGAGRVALCQVSSPSWWMGCCARYSCRSSVDGATPCSSCCAASRRSPNLQAARWTGCDHSKLGVRRAARTAATITEAYACMLTCKLLGPLALYCRRTGLLGLVWPAAPQQESAGAAGRCAAFRLTPVTWTPADPAACCRYFKPSRPAHLWTAGHPATRPFSKSGLDCSSAAASWSVMGVLRVRSWLSASRAVRNGMCACMLRSSGGCGTFEHGHCLSATRSETHSQGPITGSAIHTYAC
jgi:hypothetical protein